ncbi:MAG: hypothetical protein RR832_04740 [Bacilli bacterium]
MIEIADRNKSIKEFKAFRLINSSLTNITIYTYNMIYDRAKKMNE